MRLRQRIRRRNKKQIKNILEGIGGMFIIVVLAVLVLSILIAFGGCSNPVGIEDSLEESNAVSDISNEIYEWGDTLSVGVEITHRDLVRAWCDDASSCTAYVSAAEYVTPHLASLRFPGIQTAEEGVIVLYPDYKKSSIGEGFIKFLLASYGVSEENADRLLTEIVVPVSLSMHGVSLKDITVAEYIIKYNDHILGTVIGRDRDALIRAFSELGYLKPN